jgi:hypothetical protein
MQPWIVALLSPESVVQAASENIASPPTFKLPKSALTNGTLDPPSGAKLPATDASRARSLRSASPSKSPSKIATPSGRKMASPRKPRAPKGSGSQRVSSAGSAKAAGAALQEALTNGPSATEEKVKVGVETSVTTDVNGEETEHTKVSVDLPAGSPNLPLPADTEEMIKTAKEMVEEARKLEGADGDEGKVAVKGKKRASKRKAEDEVSPEAGSSKKVKWTAAEAKRENMRTKSMVALVGTVVVGAMVPYFFG